MDEEIGLGISWLWKLPDTDLFYYPAVWHDLHYNLRATGYLADKTSIITDTEFYNRCMAKALTIEDFWLREGREFFAERCFDLTRAWGRFNWPEPLDRNSEEFKIQLEQAFKCFRILRNEPNKTFFHTFVTHSLEFNGNPTFINSSIFNLREYLNLLGFINKEQSAK